MNKALAAALALSWAGLASAEDAKPSPFTFALHGFVSGSVYVQDANLGPSGGQHSLFVNAPTASLDVPQRDKLVFGGDVRQSRFNFSVAGPKVFANATPKAVLEIDFFGGFGSGAFGDVSLTPRLRHAYAELDFGNGNRVVVGQANDLAFAMAPNSLAHIAQPFGYGTGNIGWRRPAIFGFHTFGGDVKTEFAWEVGRAQWNDNGGIGNATVTASTASGSGDRYGFNLGEASGLPAVEARLTVASGSAFSVFATGHWNKVDRTGVGVLQPASGVVANGDLDVMAANVGGKVVAGPITLAATGFVGKNVAPLVGAIVGQFQPNTVGDVSEMGGWVQAGFNFTKQLSLWGFIGTDKPDLADARAAGFTRLQNVTTVGMLQYREGGYAVGFEFIHFRTKTRPTATATNINTVDGNQAIASVNYFF